MRFEVKVGGIGGFFKGGDIQGLLLENDALTIIPTMYGTISGKAAKTKYSLADINYCIVDRGSIWSTVRIATCDGETFEAGGLTTSNADTFVRKYIEQKDLFVRSKHVEAVIDDVMRTRDRAERLFAGDRRILDSEMDDIRTSIPWEATMSIDACIVSSKTWNAFKEFHTFYVSLEERYKSHNDRIELRQNALRLHSELPEIIACVRRCDYFFSTTAPISDAHVDELQAVLKQFVTIRFDRTIAGEDVCKAIDRLVTFDGNLPAEVARHNHECQLRSNHELVHSKSEWLRGHADYFKRLETSASYLRRRSITDFCAGLDSSDDFWQMELPDIRDEVCDAYSVLRGFLTRPEAWRIARNERFLQRELSESLDFFHRINAKLTEEQRTAAIVDDNAVRLIAGAGTGKTTTLLAKAAYLAQRQHIDPSRILAITYSKKSRKDLEARFAEHCPDVPISTIHALGYTIVGLALGKRPALAPWIEDDAAFSERAEQYIAHVFTDRTLLKHATYFVLLNESEAKPGYAFDSIAQYQDYVLRVKPISLKGERLRSVQEVMIANFLYVHGVEYKYEEPYVIDTADARHARYRPDFFLPQYNIYIEHYGIGRDGKTAPNIDAAEYAAHMAWKRETHLKYETTCIETFSYEAFEGTLIENLRNALIARDVRLELIDGKDILAKLRDRGKVTQLARLLLRLIPLWKERNPIVTSLAEAYGENEFVREHGIPVLEHLLHRYENDLDDSGYVDYSDMVVQAQSLIEERRVACCYDAVLLDEAQDLSWARARLIRTYVSSASDVRFTAVGDDWQSIYRFAGSQLDTFVDFEEWFGPGTVTLHLSETHRFNKAIEKPTSLFASRNPRQTQRSLKSVDASEPAMHFLSFDFDRGDQPPIALEELARRYSLDGRSVLFVYRTSYDAPQDLAGLQRRYPKTKVNGVTAHSSKGLEADFVVVLEANASWTGFPTVRPPEALVEPLLPAAEAFDYAEDRRLFYVACTRGRVATVICFRRDLDAPFVDELFTAAPLSTMTYFGDVGERHTYVPCRSCGLGCYEVKSFEDRTFIGCSHFPACRETAPACPSCGGIVATDDDGLYYCSNCHAHIGTACPRCRRGWLVIKSGSKGQFWGCSRWRMDRMGCDYTRSATEEELVAG